MTPPCATEARSPRAVLLDMLSKRAGNHGSTPPIRYTDEDDLLDLWATPLTQEIGPQAATHTSQPHIVLAELLAARERAASASTDLVLAPRAWDDRSPEEVRYLEQRRSRGWVNTEGLPDDPLLTRPRQCRGCGHPTVYGAGLYYCDICYVVLTGRNGIERAAMRDHREVMNIMRAPYRAARRVERAAEREAMREALAAVAALAKYAQEVLYCAHQRELGEKARREAEAQREAERRAAEARQAAKEARQIRQRELEARRLAAETARRVRKQELEELEEARRTAFLRLGLDPDPPAAREMRAKAAVHRHARRARVRQARVTGPVPVAVYVRLRQDQRCVYCGDMAGTVDHIVPLARGGYEHEDNLVPACSRCNSSKGAKLLHEWDPVRAAHGAAHSAKVEAVYAPAGGGRPHRPHRGKPRFRL